jgi:hypothetical protein
MNRRASFKRRLLLLGLIPVFGLLAVLGPLWFFMHYRFKESVKFLVARESKGRFTFDASDGSISLWKGTITLKDALLYCVDSVAGISCKVRCPEIYFSLASWKALVVDKKLIVDSLAIIAPVVDMQVRVLPTGRPHTGFQTSDILEALRKTLLHLNVHAFSLKDASFTVVESGGSVPLHGEHIDLAVSNFATVNDQDSHLLGSDKVSLSLGPQHWVLSEGGQMIDFNRLSFDSRGQRFELDSFFFRQKIVGTARVFRLSADRFFFNARHLPAIYQHAQLLLDTLICIHPVLSIPGADAPQQGRDSIGNAVRQTLFKWINIQFVEVLGGRVLVQDKTGHPGDASTRAANLRIYNLRVDPMMPAPFSSDSIRMDLQHIEFLTRDNLYRLTIGAFELHGNDALFRGVNYGPTRLGLARQVVFTAPALLVKNISIPDLLRKHIHASGAQLMAPQIRMADNKEADTVDQKRRQAADAKKIALFYHTLHNIRELIDTREFDIVDGSVNYVHTGRVPVTATFAGLSAHILLNKFFISDSLVDIKHAIPDWRIGRLELDAPGMHLEVDHYGFNGLGRHSMGEQFHLRTDKGWQLDGKNISWDVLDWDLYQRTKAIRIDSLHLDNLIVHAPKGDSASRGSAVVRPFPALTKPLPALFISVLDVDSIAFDQPNAFGALHFGIDRLRIKGIRSADRVLVWDHANVVAHGLGLDTKQGRVAVRQLQFDSEKGVSAEDMRIAFSGQGLQATIGASRVTIAAELHSTDPHLLTIRSVVIPGAGFVCGAMIGRDSLHTRGLLTIEARPLQLFPAVSAAVHLSWKETVVDFRGDSAMLRATAVEGAFIDKALSLSGFGQKSGAGMDLASWLGKIWIHSAELVVATKKITAHAADCSWDPGKNRLRLKDLTVLPNGSRDEVFGRSRWQMDFVTFKGRMLTFDGLQLSSVSKRLSVAVEKITVEGASVEASRDKHMPFRHGIEKPMPTKLIGSIPFPLRVDTTLLVDCKVTYHELSLATNRWSSIPIGNINGYVFHVVSRTGAPGGAGVFDSGASNSVPGGVGAVGFKTGTVGFRAGGADTLVVEARGRLFDGDIRRFYYAELYGDSLSGFVARSSFSTLDLTRFSQALIPAAAVSITDGRVDTAWSGWQGNRYASYGVLDLDYNKLRIKVLNKKDSVHRGFVPAFETWAARLLLRNKNTKRSLIYYERDREKFVFNYWVKTQASGVLSTLLRIKNGQYRKAFEQKCKEYRLPPGGMPDQRQ